MGATLSVGQTVCTYCEEMISSEAVICPYCRKSLVPFSLDETSSKTKVAPFDPKNQAQSLSSLKEALLSLDTKSVPKKEPQATSQPQFTRVPTKTDSTIKIESHPEKQQNLSAKAQVSSQDTPSALPQKNHQQVVSQQMQAEAKDKVFATRESLKDTKEKSSFVKKEFIKKELQVQEVQEKPKESMSVVIVSLICMLAGSFFVFFGLMLKLFSKNGKLVIEWNGDLWAYYLFPALLLLTFGLYSLTSEDTEI